MNIAIITWSLRSCWNSSTSMDSRFHKALFISADAQAVTGIALTTAGLIQFRELSLYHLAVILDLLTISANGQAVMYLYGIHQRRMTAKFSDRQRWYSLLTNPRAYISLIYISIFYALAALTYKRFDKKLFGDCLLNYPPKIGNYGGWSLGEASLMLVICVLAYSQSLFGRLPWDHLKRGEGFTGQLIHHLYKWFQPVFLVTCFIWNLVDIIAHKIANRTNLNDDSEDKIQAFGQVVPIVLLILVLLQFWDLLGPQEDVENQNKDDPGNQTNDPENQIINRRVLPHALPRATTLVAPLENSIREIHTSEWVRRTQTTR